MTSTAVAKPGPGALVANYRESYATVLPSHVNVDHWVRIVQGLLKKNPALAKAANANPNSFLSALLDCAHKGLVPGETYHLVPFGGDIVGITDWKGEVEMIHRAGAVDSIECDVVFANDTFIYDSSMVEPIHKPPTNPTTGREDWFTTPRGEMVGVYAYAKLKGGGRSRVVVMNATDIAAVKAVSKTAKRSDSMWNVWPDRAWRKTAIHQLKQWLPRSAEYRQEMARRDAAVQEAPEALTAPPAVDYDEPDDADETEAVLLCNDCGAELVGNGVCPNCDPS